MHLLLSTRIPKLARPTKWQLLRALVHFLRAVPFLLAVSAILVNRFIHGTPHRLVSVLVVALLLYWQRSRIRYFMYHSRLISGPVLVGMHIPMFISMMLEGAFQSSNRQFKLIVIAALIIMSPAILLSLLLGGIAQAFAFAAIALLGGSDQHIERDPGLGASQEEPSDLGDTSTV